MYNSYSSLNDNLKPINQYDLKPKRTTYDGMSIWLYADQKDEENPRNSIRHPLYHELPAEDRLPQIAKPRSGSAANRERLSLESGKVNEFLMNNWYNKRQEANRVSSSYQSYDMERRGRNGPYEYISQAMRNDGKKFLFVQGPRTPANFNVDPRLNKPFDDVSEYQNQYYGSSKKSLFNKYSRQRLDIQQKHAVEHGNWNLMR